MGHPFKVTPFHIQILYHIIRCEAELETVSHISEGMGALQPAVFRAIKTMELRGYLERIGGPSKGKKREVVLTDKIIALFILSEHQYNELAHYLKRGRAGRDATSNRERFRLFDSIILLSETHSYEEFYHLKSMLEFMLEHGWFDYKEFKPLKQEEIKELEYTTITRGGTVQSIYSIFKPDPTEFVIIVDILDRFGINTRPYVKTVLANASFRTPLQQFREYTHVLLDKLNRKETIVVELDRNRHKAIVKDIKKIINDVETARKLLEPESY